MTNKELAALLREMLADQTLGPVDFAEVITAHDCWDQIIDALDDGWISVEERKPKEWQDIQIIETATARSENIVDANGKPERKWMMLDKKATGLWRPLPAPPKESE